MNIVKHIKQSPAASILEVISISVTIIFLTSIAGDWFGWIIFVVMGVAYEMMKIWMIIDLKKWLLKGWKHILQIAWRFIFLMFLVCIALVAALSYSLSTIAAQKVNTENAYNNAISPEIIEEKSRIQKELLPITLELEEIENRSKSYDFEITAKNKQIDELPEGYVTASERLSEGIEQLRDKKDQLIPKKIELALQVQEIQSELDLILVEERKALEVVEAKFGVIASEEFTRVAGMFRIDPELFLKIFMLSILMGVEFGIIILMKPVEEEVLKARVEEQQKDKGLEEMDKVIEAMCSKGLGKLPGTRTISELSGVSIPKVSAYRAAFIQNGFIQSSQGASSANYGPRELKSKARKIRDQIDF